ncbi:sulfotransferase [Ghiorsea bivora]|uniref:sulfotransferase n=1 Tax=Ghiorsea bivora TaxID=1485545 RepID=UPI0005705680|nr:sulfotransferase [Ghiorsea bivora]
MEKFFMFTQGRTGSTAIIDELNKHPEIACLQELFIPKVNAPILMDAHEKYAENFLEHVDSPYPLVPFEVFRLQYKKVFSFPMDVYRRSGKFKRFGQIMLDYLDAIEQYGKEQGATAVGFKALTNHVDAHPGILEKLRQGDYQVLYLERKNVVNKVLSGVVAEQRGVYNRKDFVVPEETYTIDLDDFILKVQCTVEGVQTEKKMLKSAGFPLLEVSYEDFVADREAFFTPVFEFLGVEYRLPTQSDYSKMINKPIHEVVENYTEFAARVHELGMGDMLA